MKSRNRCIFQLSRGSGCYSPTTTSPSSTGTPQLTSSPMTGSLEKYRPLADSPIRPFDEIPGPSGLHQLPYLGLLFQMKPFTKYSKHNMQQRVWSWTQNFGPICKQRLGREWYVFLTDPNDVEKVFRNDRKYPFRGALPLTKVYARRTRESPGLTALNNEEWFVLRKAAQRAILRQKAMNKYLPIISAVADDFVDKFRREERIDNVLHHLMEFSTEGAGKLCFGVRLGCISKPDQTMQTKTMKHVETFLDCFGNQFYVMPWYKLFRSPFYQKYAKSADYLKSLTEKYIREHKERLQTCTAPELGPSLLSDLLADPQMTTADIQRTLMDVFVGGIDSTASNMTTLFYNLAKNTDKQDRLFEELESSVPNPVPLTIQLVFPVPVGTARSLDKDITLRGFHIPAHTNIVFCSGITCSDSTYFDEPEQYIPERWLRDHEKYTPIHSFAYIPFGHGPRKCIGQTFAETEIRVCTAKILRNFRLTLPEGAHEITYKDKTFRTPVTPVTLLLQER